MHCSDALTVPNTETKLLALYLHLPKASVFFSFCLKESHVCSFFSPQKVCGISMLYENIVGDNVENPESILRHKLLSSTTVSNKESIREG